MWRELCTLLFIVGVSVFVGAVGFALVCEVQQCLSLDFSN